MPANTRLRLAVAQAHTLSTTAETLVALEKTAASAARRGADLVLYPEAYLGGYPRGATFGSAVGARDPSGREQFLRYFKAAVDLGDAPVGDGDAWLRRDRARAAADGSAALGGDTAPVVAGDGTREDLERVARETGVFLVVGVVERAGGTLYCSVVYVEPRRGVIGKRRKVMPTGSERLIWGQGSPASLRAVTTVIRDVKLTLAAAICWENYMPLLRYSLYSQNVNLYLAPTADARDTWLPLLQTVASEGRCFVLSSNQCVRKSNLPAWLSNEKSDRNGASAAPASPQNVGNQPESPSLLDGSGSPTPKLGSLRGKSRRKSVFTADGHEICLPASSETQVAEDVFEESDSPSQQTLGNARGKGRRQSVFTEDGNEICLSAASGDLQSPSATEPQTSGAAEGEIGRPSPALNNGPGRRRKSIFTDEGHEILLPANGAAKADAVSASQAPRGPAELSEFACRGGSCIVSPLGEVLAGPTWEKEDDLLVVEVDFDDCLRGRLDLDVAGSYSRNDAFKLTVEGLDLSPPL